MLILKHTNRQVSQTSRDINKAKWKGCHSMALTVEICWIFLLLLYFRDVYTSEPKGVQRSFPNLSFIVCRNQAKNLQNNHLPKAIAFSSVYSKVLSASALSETFSYQSNFDCHQFTAFCQTRGRGGMYPINLVHCLWTVWSSLHGGLAGCCWPPLEQVTGSGSGRGRREQSTCTHQLSKAGGGRGLKGRALQPPHHRGAKGHFIHFSLWPLLLWGREEKQRH